MPLVVPGLRGTSSSNKQGEWMNKLMGKKITDSGSSDTMVRLSKPVRINHYQSFLRRLGIVLR